MADTLLNNNKGNKEDAIESNEEDIEKSLMCGWSRWRPNFLQSFVSPKWFIFCLSIFSLVQAILVMGLTSASLPAIEKEFGLSSKQSAVILLSNDIAGIIFLPIVSFYGTYAKKPKWIGNGAIITGVGALLMCLPKLLIGEYIIIGASAQRSQTANLCSMERTGVGAQLNLNQCSGNKGFASSTKYVAIFAIAQFVMGLGTTPVHPLGPSYMDENADPKMSPVYIGIWFMCNFLGPGVGQILGSAFLRIFTNVNLPNGVSLSIRDPRWIGAWWLGYFSLSFILFLSGAVLLCFPKEMIKFRKKRIQAINVGALPTTNREIGKGLRDFLKATSILVQNRMFMFSSFALSIKLLFGAAVAGFFPKVLVLKFGGSLSQVSLYSGIVLIPAMAGGISLGSFFMKKLSLKNCVTTAAKILVICSALRSVLSFVWLLPGCNTTNIAGLAASYPNSSSKKSLTSICNHGCRCSERVYDPVCGVDGITYFSPCFAGCQGLYSKGFGNCSCVYLKDSMTYLQSMLNSDGNLIAVDSFANETSNETEPQFDSINGTFSAMATKGRCGRDCKNLAIFLVLCAIITSMGFFGAIPQKMMTMRCVPDNLRSYALGLQLLILRMFSLIPGPLILGAIIDANCLIWKTDSCGNRGNCLEYDVSRVSYHFLGFAISATALATILHFFAWYCYVPAETESSKVDVNRILMDDMKKDEN